MRFAKPCILALACLCLIGLCPDRVHAQSYYIKRNTQTQDDDSNPTLKNLYKPSQPTTSQMKMKPVAPAAENDIEKTPSIDRQKAVAAMKYPDFENPTLELYDPAHTCNAEERTKADVFFKTIENKNPSQKDLKALLNISKNPEEMQPLVNLFLKCRSKDGNNIEAQ